MASLSGIINGCVSSSSGRLRNSRRKTEKSGGSGERFRVTCVMTSPVSSDPYKTLSIHPGASESEVKKAFRRLALQYHPDVCRGNNCGTQFHQINEAYDRVMSYLRGETNEYMTYEPSDEGIDEGMGGMDDGDWDMWEEWMGWEGAGIRDYTSHINPYI